MSSRAIKFSETIDWKNPLPAYERIIEARKENLKRLALQPGSLEPLLQYYLNGHWAEFICDWGVTYDPREEDIRLQYRPFILTSRQIEYVDWLYDHYKHRSHGLCRKHRDAGMSWIHAAVGTLLWLARRNTVVIYGSQTEDKVDKGPGDPDTLFWKIRTFIKNLPLPFQPADWVKQSKHMLVVNPVNGSVLKGGVGDNIGRGGRSTLALPDEFAEVQHPQLVESSLIANSDCIIYGSTIPTEGWKASHFYRLENQFPEEDVFVFEWWQDPRKRQSPDLPAEKEHWYVKTKQKTSDEVFKTQYLMVDNTASAVQFIGEDLILAAFDRNSLDIQIPSDRPWCIGVDAAGMGNDKIKIWRRRGRLNLSALTFDSMDGLQLAAVIQDVARGLLKTGPINLVSIERDGPGASCADQLKYTWLAPVLQAIHTGARLGNGFEYNLRAYLHKQAKDYLEEEDPYIPYSKTFLTQATAIHYAYKTGLLLIESKEEYRSRFAMGRSKAEKLASRSPDEWDSFMLTFMLPTGKLVKFPGALTSSMSRDSWQPIDKVMGY